MSGEVILFRSIGDDNGARLREFVRRQAEWEEHRFAAGSSTDQLNWNALLVKYGKIMGGVPVTAADGEYLKGVALRIYKRGWHSFRMKRCYMNCLQLKLYDDENRLSYCEGYAQTGVSPFLHAWVTINGCVADPTLDAVERSEHSHAHRAYFGIEIPKEHFIGLVNKCSDAYITDRRLWNSLLRAKSMSALNSNHVHSSSSAHDTR